MSFKPRQPRVRDRAYLDWIKQLPCLACAVEGKITHGVDPAHIRHAFRGWLPVGGGEKPSDDRCAPMCRSHHDDQHANPPEQVWWARMGVNPVALCADLVAAYPDLNDGILTIEVHALNARQAKTVQARLGGLSAPIDTAKPVTVSAHLGSGRDADGNIEVILAGVRGTSRAFVAPDSVEGAR